MSNPKSHQLIVPTASDGERLDRALAGPESGVTRGEARRLIAAGVVFVGGRRCGICSRLVRAGESITWQTPARQAGPRSSGGPDEAEPLRLVVERPGFWIFDKPAGMPVEPTRAGKLGTLSEVVRTRFGEVGLVTHRLDAATSGLLVVARQPRVQVELNALFAEHAIARRYLAMVSVDPDASRESAEGLWRSGALTIDRPLDGKRAVTHVTLLARSDTAAALLVDLDTGRTRQIRRHLAEVHLPIIGESPSGQRTGGRLLLHAYRLTLPPRFSGGALDVTSPIPAPFLTAARSLKLDLSKDLP